MLTEQVMQFWWTFVVVCVHLCATVCVCVWVSMRTSVDTAVLSSSESFSLFLRFHAVCVCVYVLLITRTRANWVTCSYTSSNQLITRVSCRQRHKFFKQYSFIKIITAVYNKVYVLSVTRITEIFLRECNLAQSAHILRNKKTVSF